MKKYVSVLELFIRSSFYKALLIFVGMAAIELCGFWYVFQMSLQKKEHMGLEMIIDATAISGIFKIGFLVLTASLVFSGYSSGCNQNYTLKRLQIKEWNIALLQCFYNGMCYFLFWTVQVVLLFIMSSFYSENALEVTNQTVMLAFYRNDFMHSMFPMEASVRWIENGIMLIGCAVTATSFSGQLRKGRFDISLVIVVAICMVAMVGGLGNHAYIGLVFAILVWIAIGFYWMFKKEYEDERRKK